MTTLPASLLARLADPHKHPAFRDGRAMCPRGLLIEEHPLIDGRRVCQRDETE